MMKDCETKYRIMKTALELIWRSSYDAVGVGEICKKAGVNKGSFYHFFPSKEDLAVAALQENWTHIQPILDQIFSPQKEPVRRLLDYCDHSYQLQAEKAAKMGFVCGCPYTSVGAEQCGQSDKIRDTARQLLDKVRTYFVSAVRDGQDTGAIPAGSAEAKAHELFTFYLGTLTRARIYNDLNCIKRLKDDFRQLLGIDQGVVNG